MRIFFFISLEASLAVRKCCCCSHWDFLSMRGQTTAAAVGKSHACEDDIIVCCRWKADSILPRINSFHSHSFTTLIRGKQMEFLELITKSSEFRGSVMDLLLSQHTTGDARATMRHRHGCPLRVLAFGKIFCGVVC